MSLLLRVAAFAAPTRMRAANRARRLRTRSPADPVGGPTHTVEHDVAHVPRLGGGRGGALEAVALRLTRVVLHDCEEYSSVAAEAVAEGCGRLRDEPGFAGATDMKWSFHALSIAAIALVRIPTMGDLRKAS